MTGRQGARRHHDERGDSTTQVILMVPVLMLLVLVGVQSAMWFHAANVAQVAASRGAGAGSAAGGGAGAATSEAQSVVVENGGSLAGVNTGISGDMLAVTVSVDVPHLVPFFPNSVSRTQREPLERFISEVER
jgi:TadE-like protein